MDGLLDFVVLMTYEWGYRLGPPQAISPINEMKKVVEYALSVMPAEKIFLGFQIYARDWLLPHVKGQEAETFSPQEAIRRAVKYGATIQYDTTAQSPFFRYTMKKAKSMKYGLKMHEALKRSSIWSNSITCAVSVTGH